MNYFLFGVLPYLALTVLIIGSIARYERDPFTWKSSSSQLLRRKQLVWGSILFHVGVLIVFFGHLVGMLTPVEIFHLLGMSYGFKQVLAIVVGGVAGAMALVGGAMLLHRRLFDARVRANSSFADTGILVLLFAQLVLGMGTILASIQHLDGSEMVKFMIWAQGIFTFRARRLGTGGRCALDLQAAHPAWPDHLHPVPVHPAGAHVLGSGALCAAPGLPDRPHPQAQGKSGAELMKQTFTDISVNGEAISPELIATEAQNHPAPKGKPGMAWMAAARALAVRTLILQEAKRRGLRSDPMELAPGLWETEEEAIIRQVLDEAVEAEAPTPQAVRAAYDASPERHRSPALFEAAHILFAARPDDVVARKVAKDQANAVLAKIKVEPKAFDALARDHSACSSRANGGRLGQISVVATRWPSSKPRC